MSPPLALVDRGVRRLSLLAGGGAAAALGTHGLPCPPLLGFRPLGTDGFVARIAPRQFLVAVTPGEADLPAGRHAGLLVLAHDCAELELAGDAPVARVLAELCACDLAQFAPDAFIPTLLAGVEVALRRAAPRPGMLIVCAPVDAPFLHEALTCVVDELGGAARGAGDQPTAEQGDP